MAIEIAPAKLTLHLHMTGVRDDGYHFIDAEMVSLDFADTLEFSDGDGLEIVGDSSLPADASNLVMRALRVLGKSAHVCLTKNLPAGAGLGGGSSDAAAVFRWAGIDDSSLAASLGADVPFCVRGGRAHVTGVGEVLDPLPYEERVFTLLMPQLSVSTPEVYRAFDDGAGDVADWNERNHLEAAAIAVAPELRRWRDIFQEITGATATLAGSGSTWFVEGDFAEPEELEGARWAVTKTIPAH